MGTEGIMMASQEELRRLHIIQRARLRTTLMAEKDS